MNAADLATPDVYPGGAVTELVEAERFQRVERPVPKPRAGDVVVAMRRPVSTLNRIEAAKAPCLAGL